MTEVTRRWAAAKAAVALLCGGLCASLFVSLQAPAVSATHVQRRRLSSSSGRAADDESGLPPPGITVAHSAAEGYHSQDGQDKWVNEHIFHNRIGGVFVDLGCYDGITYSNTYFFEMHRGWRGVCAEPNPATFSLIGKAGRRGGVAVAVSGTGGRSKPLVSAYMRSSLNASSVDYEFTRRHRITTHLVDVAVVTPRELLERHLPAARGTAIDYVSIDVEGEELSVITAWPFDQYCVEVFNIEARATARRPRSADRPPHSLPLPLPRAQNSPAHGAPSNLGALESILHPHGYVHQLRIGVDEVRTHAAPRARRHIPRPRPRLHQMSARRPARRSLRRSFDAGTRAGRRRPT